MAAKVVGPKSVTSKRMAARLLVKDHKSLWEDLRENFGYFLNPNPKKTKCSGSFVLEAVRGKGKKRKRFTSCRFKLKFKSKVEANKIENT